MVCIEICRQHGKWVNPSEVVHGIDHGIHMQIYLIALKRSLKGVAKNNYNY